MCRMLVFGVVCGFLGLEPKCSFMQEFSEVCLVRSVARFPFWRAGMWNSLWAASEFVDIWQIQTTLPHFKLEIKPYPVSSWCLCGPQVWNGVSSTPFLDVTECIFEFQHANVWTLRCQMMPSMSEVISICLTHFVNSTTRKANVPAELAQYLAREGVMCGVLRFGVLCDSLCLECKPMRKNFLKSASAVICQFPFWCTRRGKWFMGLFLCFFVSTEWVESGNKRSGVVSWVVNSGGFVPGL